MGINTWLDAEVADSALETSQAELSAEVTPSRRAHKITHASCVIEYAYL